MGGAVHGLQHEESRDLADTERQAGRRPAARVAEVEQHVVGAGMGRESPHDDADDDEQEDVQDHDRVLAAAGPRIGGVPGLR